MTWRWRLAVALGVFLATGWLAAQGRRGAPGRSTQPAPEVPAFHVNVIAARPTASSVTLSVLSAADWSGTIALDDGRPPVAIALQAGAPRDIELRDLETGRTYHYALGGPSPIISGTFTTARPPGSRFSFAVQADSHLDENTDPRLYRNTLANVVADRPDFLVDLGDTFMTDKYPSHLAARPQYLAQRAYFGEAGSAMALFLALGNHDGEAGWRPRSGADVTGWARGERTRYFPAPGAAAFYTAAPSPALAYAWSWGDALFVVLDPFANTRTKPRTVQDGWAWTLGRAQYDWLASTLASTRASFVFVFIHHLVGGQGREARGGAEASHFFEWGGLGAGGAAEFASQRPGWPKPVHDLLVEHRVSVVFHGHDHLYARQERDGAMYLEVPQPGHPREDAVRSAREYGYLSGTLLGSAGHVRVAVSPETTAVEYVKSRLAGRNGEVADRAAVLPRGRLK